MACTRIEVGRRAILSIGNTRRIVGNGLPCLDVMPDIKLLPRIRAQRILKGP